MYESKAMQEIREIRNENSQRRLSQTPNERAQEAKDTLDWFAKAIGKPIRFANQDA